MEHKSLTAKQQKVYNYIAAYIKENGRAPSQKEIAAAIGIGEGNVGKYLMLIEQKGFIDIYPGEARGIELCD